MSKAITIPEDEFSEMGRPTAVYAMPHPSERWLYIYPADKVDQTLNRLAEKLNPGCEIPKTQPKTSAELLPVDAQHGISIPDDLLPDGWKVAWPSFLKKHPIGPEAPAGPGASGRC